MSARPRAGMRIPAGTTPTDASVPKEDADRLKAKEDEVRLAIALRITNRAPGIREVSQ